MRIFAISGSSRATSSNTQLLQAVRRAASPVDDVDVFDRLDDIPHFSPDREGGQAAPAVTTLRSGLSRADLVLIATPEYAGGMPGTLKNALDWLVGSGELYGKRVVVMSAAPSDHRGQNARAWVEQTVRMQGAHVCESFTVPVTRDDLDGALEAKGAEVLARMLGALTSGECAAVV